MEPLAVLADCKVTLETLSPLETSCHAASSGFSAAVSLLAGGSAGQCLLQVSLGSGRRMAMPLSESVEFHTRFVSDGKATVRSKTAQLLIAVKQQSHHPALCQLLESTADLLARRFPRAASRWAAVQLYLKQQRQLHQQGPKAATAETIRLKRTSSHESRRDESTSENEGEGDGNDENTPPHVLQMRQPQHRPKKLCSMSDAIASSKRTRFGAMEGVATAHRAGAASAAVLDAEQEAVQAAALAGTSLFFTGVAGSGKSFLLRHIISKLRLAGAKSVVVAAPTGMAASLVGGVTVHSLLGLSAQPPLPAGNVDDVDATLEQIAAQCARTVQASQRHKVWSACDVLVIDEVSMVSAFLLDLLELVARKVRRSKQPFGGIQVVLCGDFLQLPPVLMKGEPAARYVDSETGRLRKFSFQARCWPSVIRTCMELTRVYRQTQHQFTHVLNQIRLGNATPSVMAVLEATRTNAIERHGVLPTRLCTHVGLATSVNESKLCALTGERRVFVAQDLPRTPNAASELVSSRLDSMTPAAREIELCEGAQVILLRNLSVQSGLVNGARGVVTGFDEETGYPVVRFASTGAECRVLAAKFSVAMGAVGEAARVQIPLALGWAFSVHRSQGITLDCVEVSLSRAFECGQAYVAFSRASSLESLRVVDIDAATIRSDPVALEFHRRIRSREAGEAREAPGAVGENEARASMNLSL